MDESQSMHAGDEVQLVIFELGDETYAVEIHQVKEIIKMVDITPIPRTPAFIRGIINLRGKIVIITDIKRRFNLDTEREGTHIVIVEADGNTFGIIVDDVSRVLRIAKSDIKEAPSIITEKIHAKYVKGVVVLNERLIILLDPTEIYSGEDFADISEAAREVKADKKQQAAAPKAKSEEPAQEKQEEKAQQQEPKGQARKRSKKK